MPKVTEAHLEKRRQQILDAAITCFARKGYHQTTMEDIGQEAGLSPSLAYRYFSSKDDIIVAAFRRSVERLPLSLELTQDEKDVFSVLEQWVIGHFKRFEQPGMDTYYKGRAQMLAEVIRNPKVAEKALELRQKGFERFAAVIRRGQAEGQINQDLDAWAVTVAIMANLDGFVMHWLAEPELDIQKYRDVLLTMVRGLFNFADG